MTQGSPVGSVYPGDFAPPVPWVSFSFRMRDHGQYSRKEIVMGHLSDAELEWVGRVLVAECLRRKQVKLARSDVQARALLHQEVVR